MNRDSFYFERDPTFFTEFDAKDAQILANDTLSSYLNAELLKLEQPSTNHFEATNFPKVKVTWTDSIVALVEIICALYSTGSSTCICSQLEYRIFLIINFIVKLYVTHRLYLKIIKKYWGKEKSLQLIHVQQLAYKPPFILDPKS